MNRAARAAIWTLASSLLLLAGFGALVLGLLYLGMATGSIDEAQTLANRVLAATYFRVVFFKGLLPQLLLALALWPLLGRRVSRAGAAAGRSGRASEACGLAATAAAAYLVVGPLLLSAELPGWPALQMRGLAQHAGTGALMLIAVVIAALLGRRLAYGPAAGWPGLQPRGQEG